MKKFGIWFISALALLAIAACSDDEDEINNVDVEEEYDDSYWAAQATVTSSDTSFTATENGGTINFMATGGTVILTVSCGCDWLAENDAAGLFSTTMTSTALTVTAKVNTVEEERTGTVTLKTASEGIVFATIDIIQNAYGVPEVNVGVSEWNFPAVGALTAEIAVETTAEWEAEVADGWLTLESAATGIVLTAEENMVEEGRSSSVTITCTDGVSLIYKNIAVTQDPLAFITLGDESLSLEWEATSAYVEVNSNFDWDFSYDGSNGWFTVMASGNVLAVSVLDNMDVDSREGFVTLIAGDGVENKAETQLTVVQSACTDLILTYTTTSADTSIQLPLAGTVNCTVDWGDGSSVQTVTSTLPSHTYAVAGEYDVVISGTVTHISSINISTSSDRNSTLTAVKQWGDTGLTSMGQAFQYCENLASLPESRGVETFANVTTFINAFAYTDIDVIPKGIFDNCPKVNSFYGTFIGCDKLTEIPEGLFDDCPEVTTFSTLFHYCSGLKSIPVNLFKSCTKATTFSYVFHAGSSSGGSLTGESAYDIQTIDGVETVIHLYERENYPDLYATPKSVSYCYHYQTGLDDYDDIPSGWK